MLINKKYKYELQIYQNFNIFISLTDFKKKIQENSFEINESWNILNNLQRIIDKLATYLTSH